MHIVLLLTQCASVIFTFVRIALPISWRGDVRSSFIHHYHSIAKMFALHRIRATFKKCRVRNFRLKFMCSADTVLILSCLPVCTTVFISHFVCVAVEFTGVAIEAVSDSSRYFVIRVVDESGELCRSFYFVNICSAARFATQTNETKVTLNNAPFLRARSHALAPRVNNHTGRTAFLGLGFGDRSDSFDLNVALQDHYKWVKNQEKIEQDKIQPPPELDLGFKQGETIRINMKFTVSACCASEQDRWAEFGEVIVNDQQKRNCII